MEGILSILFLCFLELTVASMALKELDKRDGRP